MTTRPGSLRRRLVLLLLLPLFLLSVLSWGWTYADTRERTNAAFDRTLGGSALAIAERVVVGPEGHLTVDIPYIALEMLSSAAEDRVFYKVQSLSGDLITGYDALAVPNSLPAIGHDPVFFDAAFENVSVRAAAIVGAASDPTRSLGFVVIVAETTQGRWQEIKAALAQSAVRVLFLICFAALVVWFGVRKGLAPLDRLAAALGRRSPSDLRPIEHQPPEEIAPLIRSINEFMVRLRHAISSLHRFTGNAGHQLRTPLAIIRANLELARRATCAEDLNSALSAAERASEQADTLIGQFLLLARLDASRGQDEPLEPVDLNRVAEETARERAPVALKAGLRLAFEPSTESAVIRGNPVLLRELLLNLLNNAIAHAAPGEAVVRVRRDDNLVVMEVADIGPGLNDRTPSGTALTAASFRTGDEPHRTGLGLSIAAEIAEHYAGRVQLLSTPGGTGVTASAIFPSSIQ